MSRAPLPVLAAGRAPAPGATSAAGERVVRVGCPAHNCGGRCLLLAHVRDGVITRIDADDRPDSIEQPQLRACPRGRAYLRRQYHPDRLLHPLRRAGARGEGRFEQITWDEAIETVAGQLRRVRDKHGNGALYVPYGTGSYNQLNGSHTARRLLNLFGGHLGHYNDYSMAAIKAATPTVYGTRNTAGDRQDWLNARYILMWGWNPAEMRDDTNSDYFVRLAQERGARILCVDPRLSLSASIADEWIPIRPGTDVAMMSAMAFVMLEEGLYDADFVRTHCSGFDASQMPAGAQDAESYSDYILGVCDGIPKTPRWAEAITGVPAETIARIGREYATTKPAILYQGYGMQRRAYGEQVVRAGCVLAAITGNVGIPGGWASGAAHPFKRSPKGTFFPVGDNPVAAKIPVYQWTEAVLRGTELGPADGLKDADHLDTDIRLIWSVASNILGGQHGNLNRTAAMLADPAKVEFIVVQDNFLTRSAEFADIVLPACTQFETWGLEDGWKYLEDIILQPKLVEPPGEARSDFAICAAIGDRLGIGEAYREGRDEYGWTAWIVDRIRETRFPDIPSLDALVASNVGIWGRPITEPEIAFADFRSDPVANPLDTPTGRVEIYSAPLAALANPAEIPAVPKYIQEWESPFGPEVKDFPLSVIGHHTLHRVHSTHENNDWLDEAFPQRVFLNPLDAAPRGIQDGDVVRVWNARGTIELPCRITNRLMPGVIDVPQGAWWRPDADGVDRRGNVNVLTSERTTPYAFGNAQHTVMAQAERVGPPPALPAPVPGTPATRPVPRPPVPPAAPVSTGHLAFHFDAAACTGCKSCQVACKDRNQLPNGMLWRRVYEAQGGGWTPDGDAWRHDVAVANLSIACNHCERPVCMEVCPTKAITRRPDGVVLIDAERCTGCRYCSWACPYDAPQFDEAAGVMTKCTFCIEDVDAGRPPSCVSACPMRALDFGTQAELAVRHLGAVAGAEGVYPMPGAGLTRPNLLVTPHAALVRTAAGTGPILEICNVEEV